MTTLPPSIRRVSRRSARALLLDDDARLVLIKRTKPGQPPYWTTPGGGIEPGETPPVALERELREEAGATADIGGRVVLVSTPVGEDEVSVQEVFLCRLRTLQSAPGTVSQPGMPAQGGYEVVRVPMDAIGDIDFKPAQLREFVTANLDALVNEAAALP